MMECIALLRGINVGRAKRIAMAQLQGLAPSRRDRHHAQLGDRPQIAGRVECPSVDPARAELSMEGWTPLTGGE
jgi:hypothetical protein